MPAMASKSFRKKEPDPAPPEPSAVVEVQEQECARIPVGYAQLYSRLDHALRQEGSALVRAPLPRSSPMEAQRYEVWECELVEGGKVRAVDVVARAREMDVIGETESPIELW